MKRRVLMLVLTLTTGIALGVLGGRVIDAQQKPVRSVQLLKTDMEGVEGKEGIMVIAEFDPGAKSAKTYHPGHELIYVLEGSGTLDVEGKPIRLKTGDVFYLPPKRSHYTTNDGTTTLRALAVFIHEKGQPVSIRVQ